LVTALYTTKSSQFKVITYDNCVHMLIDVVDMVLYVNTRISDDT